MLHGDRRRAGSFGDDAEQYDRARPGYPDPLFDDLLSEGARDVLDVGCGTGKVARMFAARGCRVLGIEPDPRMAAVARRQGLEVEVATFEAWDDRGRRFDLLVAGQAWHWVEPDAGAAKAAALLRPSGRVAVFWNRATLPPDIRAGFDEVYQRLAPDLAGSILIGNVGDVRFTATADSFRRDGTFGDPQIDRYTWQRRYTRDEWLDLLPTHSDHRTLPPDRLRALSAAVRATLDGAGGGMDVTYETVVVSARTRA